MWMDEAILEELAELKDNLADNDTRLTYITLDCARFEKLVDEIEMLKKSGRKREVKSALEFKIAVAFGVVGILMALMALSFIFFK